MATRGFAACVSLLSHHRSVEAANPWPAANDAALAPLARHTRTRSAHFAAVSASLMPRKMRPNRTTRKDGPHAGHTQVERIVQEAILKLEPSFRECLVLRDVEELSYEEIEEITGLAAGTVKSRIHRARGMLREIVEKELGEKIR